MPDRPTGTVTFLFTDIEGSTSRWEHQRQAMQMALARHDAILREVIQAHGGDVFKTVGDAFYATFATAPNAVEAALAAQQALQAEAWDTALGPIRVRMALHTGTAEERDGDYFGPPLNRVARLLSVGHGGQVLLSTVTQELVRDLLPGGTELRDLGEHRLKDLIRSERIFQLVAPNLPTTFPPLKTLDNRPNNLPLQPNPLIGREREVEGVRQRLVLPDVHLVTLTGVGGTGKTRLALQVAAEMLDSFRDGVWFVNLAPITDPALVLSAIATTLGVREAGGQALRETLQAYLHDKQLLLLLDNFEQVLPAAGVVADLLKTSTGLKVLVTSRAPLHLRGEHEFPVPTLHVPDPRRLPPVERLTQYEAVRLFIQQAQGVKPDFAVTNANAPAVAEICVRLDGLPLAIELAAARIKMLPPEALLRRLSSRLKVLTGGARDLPARQQTLRAAIDWSYSLLDVEEQRLFARLAVFVGGRTLEAIEAVCNADGDLALDVLDGVSSLVDKSLLQQTEAPEDEPRFVMLETIHEYARERLDASGEAEVLRRRHAQYFRDLVEAAEPRLTGPEQGVWLERLEAEHGNIRVALQTSLDQGEAETALRLASVLWHFWSSRGHLSEGTQWLNVALEMARARLPAESDALRAKAIHAAGTLAAEQGDYRAARSFYEESLAIRRSLADERSVARLLNNLGILAFYEEDHAAARLLYEESLAIRRRLGDLSGVANALNNLGLVLHEQGDYAAARAVLEESVVTSRELGDREAIVYALGSLCEVLLDGDDYAAAWPLLEEGLAISRDLGDKRLMSFLLEDAGAVAAAQVRPERALCLAGAAAALRENINMPLAPYEQARLDRRLAPARAQLDPAAWEMAAAEGRAMTLEQAVAYALDDTLGG
ncbi:MAG TPA: tetratricopeptide repeat protein [Herpetosiphonaceae bacterium]|nr:tetratricopeptide repeat protein [Herpetosiphonaceae bacterium]